MTIDGVSFFFKNQIMRMYDREPGSKVSEIFYDTSPRGDGEAVTMHAFCTWTSSSRCPTSLDSDLRRHPLLSPASAFPQRRRQCRPLVSHWFPTLAIVRTHRGASYFPFLSSLNYFAATRDCRTLSSGKTSSRFEPQLCDGEKPGWTLSPLG